MKRPVPTSQSADPNAPAALPVHRDKLAGLIEISANLAERQRAKADLLEAKRFLRATLDTFATHLAIINESGTIIEVNAAWSCGAQELQFIGSGCGLGENYLAACDSDSRNAAEDAERLTAGIRAVLAGTQLEFQLVYPTLNAAQWIAVRVVRFPGDGPVRAVVAHENVTDRKLTEITLTEIRKQLWEASQRAGLAEVATGVLHNVGNVLNSVTVAAAVLTENLHHSKAASLIKVAALLRQHEAELGVFLQSDEKGKQIPIYLEQLGEDLVAEQKSALAELTGLKKNLGHIMNLVSLQQGYGKPAREAESVSAPELVEDALKMIPTNLWPDVIKIIKDYQPVPNFTVGKTLALQILVNLLRNAMQAHEGSSQPEQYVRLQIARTPKGVGIAVSDNGTGIAPEDLPHIFTHGFTTKTDGHGFGLHSCQLAAEALQGTLRAQSDGPGAGATFTLELPIAPV